MRSAITAVGSGVLALVLASACPGAQGNFQFSGSINVSLQAYQANDPCGDIPVVETSRCALTEGPQQCSTACEKVNYDSVCTDHNFTTCEQKCQAVPKQECTTSCGTECTQQCRTQPAQTVCAKVCENRCSASCGAECSASPNSVGCSWRCRTTCENSCENQCQTIPATSTCEQKCGVACNTSCRTVEEMHCHEECQTQTYQTCVPQFRDECKTKCQAGQPVMVCDDQFVDASNPQECKTYLENAFRVRVNIGGLSL
jgi:hypothetical protein